MTFKIENKSITVARTAPRASTFDIFLDGVNQGRFNRDDVQGVIEFLEGKDTPAARRQAN